MYLGVKSDLAAGTNWLSGDVLGGKYKLCVSVENNRINEDAWQGKMRTKTLEVDVKDAE